MTYSKRAFLGSLAGGLIGFAGAAPFLKKRAYGESRQQPVVVELFTSQGCHSCPPAERILADLARRSDIIALEFHVDYWDYIGWKDPFADPAFTRRQSTYNKRLGSPYNYTPQMVFDGMAHAVGSRQDAVNARIEAAEMKRAMAEDTKVDIQVSHSAPDAVSVFVNGSAPSTDRYTITLFGFDGEHHTDVTRGENRGKSLVNVNIVRSMQTLTSEWSGGPLTLETSIPSQGGTSGCAVLVQGLNTGHIAAAHQIALS